MFMRYTGIGVGHSYAVTELEDNEDEEPATNLSILDDVLDDSQPEPLVQVHDDDNSNIYDEADADGTDDIKEGGADVNEHNGEQDGLDIDKMDLGPEDGEGDWADVEEEDFGQL